jgi:hypothetical protein
MKSYLLSILLLCTIGAELSAQTTYYSNGTTTNFNTLSGWSLNTNGTGAHPASFSTSVRLVVQNGHTKNTSATATVNRLTIQNGGTVTANNAITISGSSDRFEIQNGGTYIHNNTGNVSNTIFNGEEVFGISSTFQINNWEGSGVPITDDLDRSAESPVDGHDYYYGNLIINWQNSGNWDQDWNGTIRLAAGNFTISSVDEFRFTESNGDDPSVYVVGNFVMNSTGSGDDILDMAEGNNSESILFVNGNITHTNGAITASGNNSVAILSTYETGTAYWSFTGGSRNKVIYVVDNDKLVVLNSNLAMGTNLNNEAKLIIEDDGILDAQQYVISNASTNAHVENNGIIRTANMNGLWTDGQTNRTVSDANGLTIQLENGSTVEYYGATGQIVSSMDGLSSAYDDYENITLQSANTKQLEGSITVQDVFNFTGSGNYLNVGVYVVTIDDDATISNAGSTAYFILAPTSATNGRLRQNDLSTASRLFPIGSATNYLPATLTPSSNGTDFSISVFRGTTTNGLPTGTAFGSRSNQVDAVWRVDRTSGSAQATLRFDWITAPIEGASFAVTPNAQIGIWRYESGNWILTPNTPGPNFISNNTANHSSTNGRVTSFGSAGSGLSYIVADINVLPGKLLSFTAEAKANENLLRWKVADATLFNKYEVEVSKDGFNFTTLPGVLAPELTDNLLKDKINTHQTAYYRLKMWDHFSQASFSNIVVVKRETSKTVALLQNPIHDQLIFRHPSAKKASFVVVDFSGRVYMKGMIPEGNIQTSLQASSLPAGSYVLQYTDGVIQFSQKFLK